MTDQTPIQPVVGAAAEQSPGPRLYGVIDVIKPERIAGWVIDRADAAAYAEVDLLRNGKVVATVPANRPRKDLLSNGVGTGRYGFSIPLDPPLGEGMEFTLSIVARSADGVECPLQPTARLSGTRNQPEQKIFERLYTELTELRNELAQDRERLDEVLAAQARSIQQFETVQLRLETTIQQVDPPVPQVPRHLWGLAAAGIGMASLSLIVGLWSLFVTG